jgi:hypothetical protein
MTCPETRQINGPRLAAPGASLKQAFPAGLRGLPGPVAAVAHGGVTAELLRNLLGDDALPPGCASCGHPAVRHHHRRRLEPGDDRIRVTPA